MSDANKWSVNYSWTQPYSYNDWDEYSASRSALEAELDRLDAVDVLVDEMLTYPDAEAIMNKIRQQGEGNV